MKNKNISIVLQEVEGKKVAPKEIQIIRTGKFFHDWYGEMIIDTKILRQMKQNFDDKVRGVDLAVDYGHEAGKEAAGWIRAINLKANDQELWAEIEWTPTGKDKVESLEYRYLSADFSFDYKDNESQKSYGACLFGAGLTNRPFVKRMAPTTNLSEAQMELEELQALNKKLSDEIKASQDKIVILEEMNKVSDAKVKELEKKIEIDKKENEFNKMLAEGKVVPAQKDAFMAGDINAFVANAAKVNLTEQGHGNTPDENQTEEKRINEIDEKAKKLSSEKKITYAKAVSEILKGEK